MRSDYMLYSVAIILFVITGILYFILTAENERVVSVVATMTFGILVAGLGYMLRPRTRPAAATTAPSEAPTTSIATTPPPPVIELEPAPVEHVKEKTPASTEFVPLKLRLTKIKGIGEMRSTQLKSLGIGNVKDLAQASAKDLAGKLDVSPKTTARWIADAKAIVEKKS